MGNVPRDELDVRAHNGYVLAPPSVHKTGFVYQWRGDLDAIADIPQSVLDAITPEEPKAKPDSLRFPPAPRTSYIDSLRERRVLGYAEKMGYGLSDGRKTAAFVFAAFMVHEVNLSEDAAARFLDTWNRFNSPPLPSRVLDEKLRNAVRYGGRQSRGAA